MKGTPERDWYLLKHGESAAADFDRRLATLEEERQRGGLANDGVALLRELHEVFPQVRVPESVGRGMN